MNELDILKHKADVINHNSITISIDVRKQTWIERLMKEPKTISFEVVDASLGTLINFSSKVLKVERLSKSDLPTLINSIAANGRLLAECIAILIEDTEKEPSDSLVKLILKNVSGTKSKRILVDLINHSKIEDFMSSIILVTGMSLLKPEEIIASEPTYGKQSET